MKYTMNRRELLAATAFAGATLAFGSRAFAADDAAATLKGSGKVVVSTWGGSYVDAQTKVFFKPFTDATGIEVVTTGTPDAAKLKLMQQSGNVEWDLLDAEGQMMLLAAKDDLIQKVNYDLIHKVTPADDPLTEALNEYGFPSVAFGWVLTWNTDTYKSSAPGNWAGMAGKITAFRGAQDAHVISADSTSFVMTRPFSLANMRLIAANWMSSNIGIYALALLLACIGLGVGTFLMLRRLGRRS